MDKLKAMSVFIAVAEEQGFAAAARRLALSAPAITRTVAELEEHLGVILLLRTTRRVRLTEAGQRFLQDARRIVADVTSTEESIRGIHGNPSGHLVVTAPAMFGCLHVTPVMTAFQDRYENVTVSALFVDRITDLIEEGIDVGIRIGALPDSSMRAIELGTVTMKTYAAPQYLQHHGEPAVPEDLYQHRLIASTAGSRGPQWRYYQGDNEITLRATPVFSSTTNDSVIAAAVAGHGITRVLSYQAAAQVAAGALQPILTAFEGPPIPVSIVHPQGRNLPAKVRAFIDLAVPSLRQTLGTT
ncbi:MAG: LysR substrate-binding domain-containing protein [Pseudomonadota bacterium]|nr:LysR substrate-binding domain-containing protein [Pseudomonadota bacterium]